jgi:uncharacterized membrane protein YkoI
LLLSQLLLTIAIAGAFALPPEVPGSASVSEPVPVSDRGRSGVRQRMSLDEAAAMVRDRFGGRVIRAESRRGNDGHTIHEIRLLLENGRVRTVRVDAESGRIID